MKRLLISLFSLVATTAFAQFGEVRVDGLGNVIGPNPVNYITGQSTLQVDGVAVTPGGGGGSPGGSTGDFQYKVNSTTFGGTSLLNLSGGLIQAQGASFLFTDITDPTKRIRFSLTNVPTGVTEDVIVPNHANPVLVAPATAPSNQFSIGIGSSGTIAFAQPAFTDISGTATNGQLPTTISSKTFDDTNTYTAKDGSFTLENTASTTKKAIFGLSNITAGQTRTINVPDANSTTIQADTGAANNFLTAVSAQGVISKAQPAFSNLSGNWTLAQGPTETLSTLLGRGSSGNGVPQEITLGSGLSMSGTTLSVSAGGGNVSNSGTPTSGQVAIWQTATTIAGITPTSPINSTSSTLTLDRAVDFNFTTNQSFTIDDVNNASTTYPILLSHTTSGTPTIGLGTGLSFNGETSVNNKNMGSIETVWSTVTDASRSAYMDFLLVNNATTAASKMRLWPSGGLSLNNTTDPGIGTFSTVKAPLANTIANGILLTNPTTATSGNQQYPPYVQWTGQGFLTGTGSQTSDWRAGFVSIDIADALSQPKSEFHIDHRQNGGSWLTRFRMDSTGNITPGDGDASILFATIKGLDWVGVGGDGSHPETIGIQASGVFSGPGGGALRMNNVAMLLWSSSGPRYDAASADLGLSRVAANTLAVTDGASISEGGAYRDVHLRNLIADNTLQVTPLASAPGSPSEGWIYGGTDHKLYYRTNTAWVDLTASGTGTPAGASGDIQVNNGAGSFGADSNFNINTTTHVLNAWGAQLMQGPLSSGAWLDMPTSGPSGIGTGGVGSNPWVAYAAGAGQWFTSSAAGDVAYRNATGKKLAFGVDNASHNATLVFTGDNLSLSSVSTLGWASGEPLGTAMDTGMTRKSAGLVQINNGTLDTLRDLQLRDVTARGLISSPVAFASRIATPTEGTLQAFTDSVTNTQGATVTGGGTNHIIGYYDGTNWLVTSGTGGGGSVDDTAFASSWNAVTTTAPSKNAVYDWGHTFDTDDDGKVNVLDQAAGITNTDSSGVIQTPITAPSGAIVGTSDTQTLTNKRINPRVDSSTAGNATTWAPNADTTDIFELSGTLTVAVTTISNPSGTPVEGQRLMIRVKSDSSAHALTWSGTQWRASGATGAPALPTTTTAAKNLYVGFVWNSTDSKWDLLAVQDGF